MENSTLSPRLRGILLLLIFAVVVVCTYTIVSAIITAHNTGVLYVTTDPKATITISRMDSQAKVIGSAGKANVRLEPGSYQVMVGGSGQRAAKLISIKKNSSIKVNLPLHKAPTLPGVADVTFYGIDSLNDLGLTYQQSNLLKLDFFHFKTSAQTVTIDSQSGKMEPYSYNSTAPIVYDFSVTVDSETYNAKIVCSSSDIIRLYLYKADNNELIFDSYANQEQRE